MDRMWEDHYLNKILKAVNWAPFEDTFMDFHIQDEGGHDWDPVVLFRCLLLAEWNSLGDRALEESLAFRLDFRRFAGISPDQSAPDASAFSAFRNRLGPLRDQLLDSVNRQITGAGLTIQRSVTVSDTLDEIVRVDNARREHEEELQILIDTSPVPIAVYDTDGRVILFNRKFVDLFGYTQDEIQHIEEWWPRAYPDADYREEVKLEWNRRAGNAAREKGELVPMETTVTCRDGSVRYVEFRLSSTGKKFFVTVTDFTERKKAEEALRRSEFFLNRSQHVGRIGSFILETPRNEPSAETWVSSETMDDIFGIDVNYPRTGETWLNLIVQREEVSRYFSDIVYNRRGTFEKEYQITRPCDGNVRWIYGRGELEFDDRGEPQRMIGTVQDITERKMTEETLLASVREKEVLLKELYHRTNNNMQVICGLLSLQDFPGENATLQSVCTEIQTKIQTMALVHQKLYESRDLANINLRSFIESLVDLIAGSFTPASDRVSIRHSVDSVPISIDIATPLGLVMNELMTNSIKHAFPDGRMGEIVISMRRNGEHLDIEYLDNGTGLPEGLDPARSTSFGMQIIQTITRQQLKGDIVYTGRRGFGFGCHISIKTNLYIKRV